MTKRLTFWFALLSNVGLKGAQKRVYLNPVVGREERYWVIRNVGSEGSWQSSASILFFSY